MDSLRGYWALLLVLGGAARAERQDSLRTTHWNIASYLYLLNFGKYDQTGSEANIDYAARLGFNAVRFNLWWHEIEAGLARSAAQIP
jgi:hypothetical protein